eukprot:6197968-Pleurochrysis_carterae.AAC.1
MPCKAIQRAQRSAEGTGTARNTGQAIVQYPEPISAQGHKGVKGGNTHGCFYGRLFRWKLLLSANKG